MPKLNKSERGRRPLASFIDQLIYICCYGALTHPSAFTAGLQQLAFDSLPAPKLCKGASNVLRTRAVPVTLQQ